MAVRGSGRPQMAGSFPDSTGHMADIFGWMGLAFRPNYHYDRCNRRSRARSGPPSLGRQQRRSDRAACHTPRNAARADPRTGRAMRRTAACWRPASGETATSRARCNCGAPTAHAGDHGRSPGSPTTSPSVPMARCWPFSPGRVSICTTRPTGAWCARWNLSGIRASCQRQRRHRSRSGWPCPLDWQRELCHSL